MAKQSFPLLITRPRAQSLRFSAQLTARFGPRFSLVVSPLIEPHALMPALPARRFGALVLTSETGAETAGRYLQAGADLPTLAYCVGDRTAEAAAAQGLSPISAGGDARDLARLLTQAAPEGGLLYLHGRDRAADLAALLPTLDVTSLVTYEQRALPLSPEAMALLARDTPLIVPLFSPRSARLFIASMGEPRARIIPVVISENARLALPPLLREAAVLAQAPTADAMIHAIETIP